MGGVFLFFPERKILVFWWAPLLSPPPPPKKKNKEKKSETYNDHEVLSWLHNANAKRRVL